MIVFKAPQDKVLAVMQSISGIVERRHTVPILANVLLRKSGTSLQLTTSDLEVQIRTTVDLGGDAEQDFSTTIGARKLIEILRTFQPDQVVSLESSQERFVLKGGKSRFTLQSLPGADFPLVQEMPNYGPAFSVPQAVVKKLLGQVAFAMAVQDIRYYLNGILFVAEGHSLSLVSTDGHRLAFASATLDNEVPRQEVILPRKTVVELQRLLRNTPDARDVQEGEKGAMIEFQFANNQARLRFNNLEFVTKLVEGKFPDYNRVIPVGHTNTVTLGRHALQASLQRMTIMTTDKFKGVRLNFEPGILRISSANTEHEEAQDEIEIDYGGPRVESGFNVSYLLDVLANVPDDMVNFSFEDGSSSALISVPDDANFKYVVMPMRV